MHANVMAGSLLYMYVAPPLVSVKYNHAENNPGLHVQSNFTDLLLYIHRLLTGLPVYTQTTHLSLTLARIMVTRAKWR